MPRLSINEFTTYRWSFEDDVVRYAAAGIPAMGVWRQKLSDFGEQKGAELLAEMDMSVSCLMWAGGFTGSDGGRFVDAVADGLEALELAAELNARCLVVYSGDRGLHTASHARRLVREALQELAPAAEQLDVDLAIEPMHPGCADGWTFLRDLDTTLDLLDEVGHPRAKLVFDVYHMGHDDEAIVAATRIVDRIALVQLGDAGGPPRSEQNRRPLGGGSLPLADIMDALIRSGYDGDFDVELLGEDLEGCCYDSLLQESRDAYEQLVGCHSAAV